MITENNGHSEKLENWTSKKLSALSLIPFYLLIRLTSYFEAFELKDNCNSFGSIWFLFQNEVILI